MLIKAKSMTGYTLASLDGEIGKAKEFYFDDQRWGIRYLVADTGHWLRNRQVLISPYALVGVDREAQQININLTRQQIEESPPLESDQPVSRQFEDAYYGFFRWPMYWGGPHLWGAYPFILRDPEQLKNYNQGEKTWDPYLRSTHDVIGHHIQTVDAEIGHVVDFLIDDQTWAIRYLVVDTRNWWPGKQVLIPPEWIERDSWLEAKVFVNLPSEAIRQAPEYTDELMLTQDFETILQIHYHHKGFEVHRSKGRKPSR